MISEMLLALTIASCVGFIYLEWNGKAQEKSLLVADQDRLVKNLSDLEARHNYNKAEDARQQEEIEALRKSVEALGNLARGVSVNTQELDGDVDKVQEHLAFLREKLVALEEKMTNQPLNPSKPIPIYVVKDPSDVLKSKSIYKKIKRNGEVYWIRKTETRRVKKKVHPGIRKAKDALVRAGLE